MSIIKMINIAYYPLKDVREKFTRYVYKLDSGLQYSVGQIADIIYILITRDYDENNEQEFIDKVMNEENAFYLVGGDINIDDDDIDSLDSLFDERMPEYIVVKKP